MNNGYKGGLRAGLSNPSSQLYLKLATVLGPRDLNFLDLPEILFLNLTYLTQRQQNSLEEGSRFEQSFFQRLKDKDKGNGIEIEIVKVIN